MESKGGTVNVSQKGVSFRRALAQCTMQAGADAVEAIKLDTLPKSGAIATARAAGMLAAKKTAELIPHCHPVSITSINFDFQFATDSVTVLCEVSAWDRTGPEMEALCGATIAALTLYDMIKGIYRGARLLQAFLLEKDGGKSGLWRAGQP